VVESLLGRGFDIRIFDRNISLARLTGKNLDFITRKIPHLTELMLEGELEGHIQASDVIVVSNGEPYFNEALSKCSGKVILDMVGLDEAVKEGNDYQGINW